MTPTAQKQRTGRKPQGRTQRELIVAQTLEVLEGEMFVFPPV